MLKKKNLLIYAHYYIPDAGSEELKAMGARGRENLEKNLTRNVSVRKYAEEILKL